MSNNESDSDDSFDAIIINGYRRKVLPPSTATINEAGADSMASKKRTASNVLQDCRANSLPLSPVNVCGAPSATNTGFVLGYVASSSSESEDSYDDEYDDDNTVDASQRHSHFEEIDCRFTNGISSFSNCRVTGANQAECRRSKGARKVSLSPANSSVSLSHNPVALQLMDVAPDEDDEDVDEEDDDVDEGDDDYEDECNHHDCNDHEEGDSNRKLGIMVRAGGRNKQRKIHVAAATAAEPVKSESPNFMFLVGFFPFLL